MKKLQTRKTNPLLRRNLKINRERYPNMSPNKIAVLRELTAQLKLSIYTGELLYINENWYVSHAGLLQIAKRRRCVAIRTELESRVSNPAERRWIFKATVYKREDSRGFVGYGDADPSNVSPVVLGAEMRIAETRAVNRALRKAYGIGTCSVEELGAAAPAKPAPKHIGADPHLGTSNGHSSHPLRDQLNPLIHEHQLDPALVKRYAAEFCGTQTLRDASKELVEDFIGTLSKKATEDLAGLKCQLNSYQTAEVRS